MTTKTISVIIPFKSNQVIPSVERCIKSLFAQTVLPLEVIIVGPQTDVHVSPNFRNIVKIISFVGDKNEARNLGILKATGDYILYLDHDMVADKDLVKNCMALSHKYDAIIVPERGVGEGFWENCKRLEKELIAYDIHTVTPRFYRRSLFSKEEKPFDSRLGLLDEWGFNHKLMKKNISLGYARKLITVKEIDFSLLGEIKNKFKRGLWMRNFYQIDKKEAWMRINPFQRGIIFYTQRLHYFFKEPIYFLGLIFLKAIDFMSFMAGYFISYFIKPRSQDE